MDAQKCLAFIFTIMTGTAALGMSYHMKTAEIRDDGKLVFASDADFDEALAVGFFRVKRPSEIDISKSRDFAHSFTQDKKYTEFGMLDFVNGYLLSEKSQSVRFCLERDNWDRAYPAPVKTVGHQMAEIGVKILGAILRKFELPEDIWFNATAGCSAGEGSFFLVFNHYDPKIIDKPHGLDAHTDWGYITVLDAVEEGLEVKINGEWQKLVTEDGFFIINFGEPLHRLLPMVSASLHRVPTQTKKIRTSTVLFLDPRMGKFRADSGHKDEVARVWDWDASSRELKNGQTSEEYAKAMSQRLYGTVKGN
ncbi:MAG TPA: 2OG-Fe(II) oxygenase family protein [Myxococcota bacterium]|nr:2OG-Fe(II) oxygenase family protein [Myxococcota bacterium]